MSVLCRGGNVINASRRDTVVAMQRRKEASTGPDLLWTLLVYCCELKDAIDLDRFAFVQFKAALSVFYFFCSSTANCTLVSTHIVEFALSQMSITPLFRIFLCTPRASLASKWKWIRVTIAWNEQWRVVTGPMYANAAMLSACLSLLLFFLSNLRNRNCCATLIACYSLVYDLCPYHRKMYFMYVLLLMCLIFSSATVWLYDRARKFAAFLTAVCFMQFLALRRSNAVYMCSVGSRHW